MAPITLEIQMLGDFRIRIGERVIADADWNLRKAAGIVKLLALEPGHRLHREQVMDTLWPDLDRDAAANNLRYALHTARRILNTDGALARDGVHLLLRQSGDVRVDVRAFETAADAAWNGTDPAAFARAINLYAGDLLPDDLFDEWLEPYRVTLRTTWLALLSRLAKLQEDLRIPQAAITTLQTLVDTDPGHEEATARLMLLLAGNGRRAEALSEYERLETFLARDLDTVPEPVTRQLAEAIRDGKLGQPAPLTASAPKIRTTIPVQTTTFVGRERELVEIRHLLGRSRLVTITGPGGAGKTRMAIHVAGQNAEQFPDGVFFVELAPVTRPELVVPSIIHALGLQEVAGQTPHETLTGYIGDRLMLLVLDNIEHVNAAATEFQDILQTCPGSRYWPRAGLRSGYAENRSTCYVRFPVTQPLPCSSSGPARRVLTLHLTRNRWRSLPRSATGSTGCHWRSSLRRHEAWCSRRRPCSNGSTGRWTFSPAASATFRTGIVHCGTPSVGATKCWERKSATCSPGWQSALAGVLSTQSRHSLQREATWWAC